MAMNMWQMIKEDFRVPLKRHHGVRHSFFVASIPKMVFLPLDPPRLERKTLIQRMKWVYGPIFSQIPKAFTSPLMKEYLKVNQTFFPTDTRLLLTEVIEPLETAYRRNPKASPQALYAAIHPLPLPHLEAERTTASVRPWVAVSGRR